MALASVFNSWFTNYDQIMIEKCEAMCWYQLWIFFGKRETTSSRSSWIVAVCESRCADDVIGTIPRLQNENPSTHVHCTRTDFHSPDKSFWISRFTSCFWLQSTYMLTNFILPILTTGIVTFHLKLQYRLTPFIKWFLSSIKIQERPAVLIFVLTRHLFYVVLALFVPLVLSNES